MAVQPAICGSYALSGCLPIDFCFGKLMLNTAPAALTKVAGQKQQKRQQQQ